MVHLLGSAFIVLIPDFSGETIKFKAQTIFTIP